MPKTAVGLFVDQEKAQEFIKAAQDLSFPQGPKIRALGEPLDFGMSGVVSIARWEFSLELIRELMRIGASKEAAEAYAEGVRRGGVLTFATGEDQIVDAAASMMDQFGAEEVEEVAGPEPHLPSLLRHDEPPARGTTVSTGRITQRNGGARVFVW